MGGKPAQRKFPDSCYFGTFPSVNRVTFFLAIWKSICASGRLSVSRFKEGPRLSSKSSHSSATPADRENPFMFEKP